MCKVIITVRGMVQGIGFRPFVARLAEQLNIRGYVLNIGGVVKIAAAGDGKVIEQFVTQLRMKAPSGAEIASIEVKETESENAGNEHTGFFIAQSVEKDEAENEKALFIPADLPTCPDCERELYDEQNRRFRYPFISCVSCGPRYSIIRGLPYDRDNITMDRFPMCPQCRAEYIERNDRRRHAQTIGCRDCGPVLTFTDIRNNELQGDAAYNAAVSLIKQGGIAAVKDIGGFHLVCKPDNRKAVRMLREIKGREKKPFAVCFQNVDAVKKWAYVSELEEKLLTGTPRPIVLLKKKLDITGEENSPYLGAMLPCNPLQIMLVRDCGALIMTSANPSGEPIITGNKRMMQWLCSADCKEKLGVLSHDREILTPLDDSIVREVRGGRVQIIRRSRGYVPNPVQLPATECGEKKTEIFAAGGDLKSVFCFVKDDKAYLSQHLGDLESVSVMELYEQQLKRMKELFGFRPQIYAADKHIGYFSSKRLKSINDSDKKLLQHHHCHIASVVAEHGLAGKTLGFALDGTGLGDDGSVWGGEILLCDGKSYERIGHLKQVSLPGGDESARNADASLYGYLAAVQEYIKTDVCEDKHLAGIPEWIDMRKAHVVEQAVKQQINTVTSSSMGRLFDAVSALLNICHYNDYEGEAAIGLEYTAGRAACAYKLAIPVKEEAGKFIGQTDELFMQILDGIERGIDIDALAYGFHMAVAYWILESVRCAEKNHIHFDQIALSGGTFQNGILLDKTIELLEKNGYNVYINEKVPSGDGGLCLGQAYLLR